ncbi:MAG: hypothetical protein ISR65_06465 [Bacteriovoracaceae bacterium]|nr:hypothetical protein [Bacteriovoracaceae bacterium]
MSNREAAINGEQLERYFSKEVHRMGLPLLISPLCLRDYGCGQVDLANMQRVDRQMIINLYEVKKSLRVNWIQNMRLKKSSQLLGMILGLNVIITYLTPKRTLPKR